MEKTFFDQLIKNYLRTYDCIRKIETGQGDDYKVVICWLFKQLLLIQK